MNIVIDFFNKIRGNKTIQFTNLKDVYNSYNDSKDRKVNTYFVGGLDNKYGTGKSHRAEDVNITEKTYFVLDIDIRKTFNNDFSIILSDDEMETYIDEILSLLDKDELLSQYSYVVNSGNGVHIYYLGQPRYIEPHIYKIGVGHIYELVNKVIEDTGYTCDKAMKNISSLSRVPYSMNYSRSKYGGEPKQVEIIKSQYQDSTLFNSIEVYADEVMSKEVEINTVGYQFSDTYNSICEVNVADLFTGYTGIKLARDGRNFISPKDGGYIGLYYIQDRNLLINSGTGYLKSDFNAYGPFSYVKHEILKTEEPKLVYDWFKDNYPNIRDISDKDTERYIKEKQEKESKESGVRDLVRDKSTGRDIFFNKKKKTLFSWGIDDVDKRFGKIQVNDLAVFVGNPASGKTAYTYFMTRHNAEKGIKIRYFTLELNPSTLKMRTACDVSGISKINYQEGNYTEIEGSLACKYYDLLDSNPNIDLVGYDRTPNIDELCAAIEDGYNEGYELFFIDNLGKINGTGRNQSENDVQIEITGKLQSLKNKYPIAIVLLHHLKKKQNGDSSSMSSEKIRGSQKISDNATIVVGIERDGYTSNLTMMKDTMGGIQDECRILYEKGDFVSGEDKLF